jgi:integrase
MKILKLNWWFNMEVYRMTEKFCKSVQSSPKLKAKTKNIYTYIVYQIPDIYLRERFSVRLFYRSMADKKIYSKKRMALYCSVLRKFYNYFEIEFEDYTVKTHKREEKLKDAFEIDEIRNLLYEADGDFTQSWITLLYRTGLRVGELIGSWLKTGSEDEIIKIGFVGKGKRKAEELWLKPDADLRKHIRVYYATENYHKRKYYSMWDTFRKLKDKCVISSKRKTIHSLRHYAAQQYYMEYGLAEAQKLLRHSNSSTTMIYLSEEGTRIKPIAKV